MVVRSPLRWFDCFVGILMLAIGLPSGCTQNVQRAEVASVAPTLRVLILQAQTSVKITASQPPFAQLGAARARKVDLPSATTVTISYGPSGWQMGAESLGPGDMTLLPASEGSLSVEGHAYRGRYRFIPRSNGQFDVINDVGVEAYLKGVLSGEMLATFADETYKAQAVVARTYAIYEKQMHSTGSDFDLYSDERSMMYGGISSETARSIAAVKQTRGMVVAYGTPGSERIFKAYFSSCCGGAGQSAAEAFGDRDIPPPLEAQACGNLCSNSPRFVWPTVIITKADLTRRIQHYAQLHSMPEKDMAAVTSINILSINAVGRPVLFTITDAKNRRYAILGEELRRAVNLDSTPTTRLWSSYFQLDNQPREIRFFNGHGFGHGVGMCQWCAQRRAELGMDYRQIVLLAYPRSTLVKAY